jgi:hypothetical protein
MTGSVLPDDLFDALLRRKQEAMARVDFLIQRRKEITEAACLEIDKKIDEARKAKDKAMEDIAYHYVPYLGEVSETSFNHINTVIQNSILTFEDEILGGK